MKILKAAAIALMLLAMVGLASYSLVQRVPTAKEAARAALQRVGLEPIVMPLLQRLGLATPLLPEQNLPILPDDRVSARRMLVSTLGEAEESGDFVLAARLNAILSQEAYQRVYRALKAWETARDPETGLVPFATHPRTARWEPEHAGADLYPFLWIASHYLDPESEELWSEALANERRICGPMPCALRLGSLGAIERGQEEVVFGASEFAKDGLLAIAERMGSGPWFDRLEEVESALLEDASVATDYGLIASRESEVNGEMLQVLTRLFWKTRETKYLEGAERIAEIYFYQILPRTGDLPPFSWDFDQDRPIQGEAIFRDHGSEIIPGLVELYMLEKRLGRAEAERYREPLRRLLDAVLRAGRTKDGLWYSSVDIETGLPVDRRIVDTWGYLLSAYQIFDLAEGSQQYADVIRGVMQTVASYRSYPWEGKLQDGYADSLESMLYLLPWVDLAEGRRWVDDQIEVMFAMQTSSGFIEEWYLDGNFMRTALLYGVYKSQGTTLSPWRWDVRLGAAREREGDGLYIYASADEPWEGMLVFDVPRHQTFWEMPDEYPRVNAAPEWFTVAMEGSYRVLDVSTGQETLFRGEALARGLPITLGEEDGKSIILYITPENLNAMDALP